MPDPRASDVRNETTVSAPTSAARAHLLWEVADLYYRQGRSQKEIARRIGRSVATVSRLLAEGRANETIDVQVRYPVPIDPELQRALVARFGLRLARVARQPPRQEGDPLVPVADLTARLLATLLTDGAVISVAWGTSVYEVARRLKPSPYRDVHVVQGLGSLGSLLPAVDNPWVAQMFAERLGGTPHFLPAPMVVESKEVRDALARDPQFCETLRLCGQSDIALVGIGLADPSLSGICRAGYLDRWTMERIHARGAVGDVMMEFFDVHGRIQETDIGDRVFGMRRADLANAGTVVAIARGAAKAPAILGALRTGLIDVLATDDLTARQVLELADAVPAPDAASSTGGHKGQPIPVPEPTPRGREAPLAGLRVIAVEQFGAGPFGSLLLADLGAEVIKIEDAAAGGDVGRSVPPGAASGYSLYFEAFNRGKRSITLDLTNPAGREVLLRLVATADAVSNNLRGDLPERLGLTYAALRETNPAIVCVSLSAFGREGPRRAEPGYDALVQAEAGWAGLTGEPGGPPARSGLPLADYAAGLVAACGVLAGVIDARRTGRGRDLDTSLLDTALAMLSYQGAWWLSAGIATRRLPQSAHPTVVPFQFFATLDGHIAVACAKDKFFDALAAALDLPELRDDPRFAGFAARHEHRDVLLDILSPRFRERSTAEWLDLLRGRVPCAPVRDLTEALDPAALAERGMLAAYGHAVLGEVKAVGVPLTVSGYEPDYRPAPALGADTAALLAELGFDAGAVAAMKDAGAFGPG